MKQMKGHLRNLYYNISTKQLEGIGVIEIILILVIIIGLILIFRNQIEHIIQTAFSSITSDTSGIENDIKVTP